MAHFLGIWGYLKGAPEYTVSSLRHSVKLESFSSNSIISIDCSDLIFENVGKPKNEEIDEVEEFLGPGLKPIFSGVTTVQCVVQIREHK